jgi:hypothetical protein
MRNSGDADSGQVDFRREGVEESARVFGQSVDEVIDLVGIAIVDQRATASLDQVGIGAGEASDAILVHGAAAASIPEGVGAGQRVAQQLPG